MIVFVFRSTSDKACMPGVQKGLGRGRRNECEGLRDDIPHNFLSHFPLIVRRNMSSMLMRYHKRSTYALSQTVLNS